MSKYWRRFKSLLFQGIENSHSGHRDLSKNGKYGRAFYIKLPFVNSFLARNRGWVRLIKTRCIQRFDVRGGLSAVGAHRILTTCFHWNLTRDGLAQITLRLWISRSFRSHFALPLLVLKLLLRFFIYRVLAERSGAPPLRIWNPKWVSLPQQMFLPEWSFQTC